jgi:hypothetical protein
MAAGPASSSSSSSSAAAAAASAAARGLSKGKRTFAGVLSLTVALVAGIHLNQRWEREVCGEWIEPHAPPPRSVETPHALTTLPKNPPSQPIPKQGMTAGPRRDAEQYQARLKRLREEGLLPGSEGGEGG